jgi:D-3-phosphoglycerate dehydrogenase/(S)-sulfolactate dehydrogenase
MARVLVSTLFITSQDDPALGPLLADGHQIDVVDGISVRSEAALSAALPGIAATLASTEPYSAAVLAQAPELRVISRTGVGFDAIDVAEATRRGIIVCTTPGTNQHAVADLAVALILASARRLVEAVDLVRGGGWTPQPVGFELRGTTIGIVGTGLIGREVTKRLHGFEPRLIAYDVVESAEVAERFGVQYVPLDQLLAEADVVTIHAPLLPETRGMFNAAAFSKMKPTAYLVNTARGPLVDEAALDAALRNGQIAGAALDVTHVEPLPASSPLRQAPNLVLTPHIAGSTRQAIAAMKAMAVDNAARVLRGEPPLSCVNPEALPRAVSRR